jgi:hypothetical protein
MRGKVLCKASLGRITHVHGDVEVGDHILVARGATVPFIIRPTSSGEPFNDAKRFLGIFTFYKLVGGSYIHDIMDGELSGVVDGTRFKEETIYLI